MAKQNLVEAALKKEESNDIESYARAAEFYTAYLGTEVMSDDVAALEGLLAMAKQKNQPSRDNLSDIVCSALTIKKLRGDA